MLKRMTTSISAALVLTTVSCIAIASDFPKLKTFDMSNSYKPIVTRDSSSVNKLSSELRTLLRQFSITTRGAGNQAYSDVQLEKRFGIKGDSENPVVELAITIAPGTDTKTLQDAGVAVNFCSGDTAFGSSRIRSLEKIVRLSSVKSISAVKSMGIPVVPPSPKSALKVQLVTRGAAKPKPAPAPAQQNFTGKGVIVGVVDSGIDWRHPDFIKEDGTSRILYLYDMSDDSWNESGGKKGTKPPFQGPSSTGIGFEPMGTLYTNAQISAALKYNAWVSSRDSHGHGTACAGIAAGNGRATANGVPAGTYTGVAKNADLIIVKTNDACTSAAACAGAGWIAQTAKTLKKPCVVSMSLGTLDSSHDGTEPSEQLIDQISGPGKPGVAVCISAGNDGKRTGHASGKFGPAAAGQADTESNPIELFVTKETYILGYFDRKDDWGLGVIGLDNFIVKDSNEPACLLFSKDGGDLSVAWSRDIKIPSNVKKFFDENVDMEPSGSNCDRIMIKLPEGKYVLYGFGNSKSVSNGRFDLYIPFDGEASFGGGADMRQMVATPGNAKNAITVGSYDFQGVWDTSTGKRTTYNLTKGDLSYYSSAGYRRDGVVKPEIVAPARFAISSLAKDCEMGMGQEGTHVTKDGYHLAWDGTSAACPYVAGVVALMLEKNPTLDAQQIKNILQSTAIKDKFTGAVPNQDWGYGKINLPAALKAVPAK